MQARADRALSTHAEYLGAVRSTLKLQVDDDRLDSLAARLVSRLALIETVVPEASQSVGGVPSLQRWLDAELATTPPAAAANPAAAAQPEAKK